LDTITVIDMLKTPNFETKDSGERIDYPSGMRRDVQEGKVRYDLVDMDMFKRWAELMTRGAEKYGDNNWKLANSQEELDRFKASAFRHFMQWFNEWDSEEDHGAAVFFNISAAEYVKKNINVIPKNR
jgi:hypothetical protein